MNSAVFCSYAKNSHSSRTKKQGVIRSVKEIPNCWAFYSFVLTAVQVSARNKRSDVTPSVLACKKAEITKSKANVKAERRLVCAKRGEKTCPFCSAAKVTFFSVIFFFVVKGTEVAGINGGRRQQCCLWRREHCGAYTLDC